MTRAQYLFILTVLSFGIQGQDKKTTDSAYKAEYSGYINSADAAATGTFISNTLKAHQNKDLDKMQGVWKHQSDSLATINVSGHQWVFSYLDSSSTSDFYEITFRDTIFGKSKVQSKILMLSNSTDILEYEILGLNNNIFSLMYLPAGRLHLYNKVKKGRK